MSNFISLEKAKNMTSFYRQQKDNIIKEEFKGKDILSICETFDADQFSTLIAQPGCAGIRVYFGMGEDLKIHAIFVGVTHNDEDMLPSTGASETVDGDGDQILEDGQSCPPICPPPSPLNGG